MLLLIGPAVAVIGIVAVGFVMRHKPAEKRHTAPDPAGIVTAAVRGAKLSPDNGRSGALE